MLDIKECLNNGLEVVQQCARWFFNTNASHYQTQGFDYGDIEGHLNAEVLMRYLQLVEKQPDFYKKEKGKNEMESFRSSLYQSCRNACFAHHRKHIRSQKRGLNLRNGMVHLDHSELNSEGIVVNESLIVDGKPDYSSIYKPIADSLYDDGEFTALRLWCLLWHENKPWVTILMSEVGNDKERVISKVREKVVKFLPDTAPNISPKIMDPQEKEKFRKLAQKALQTGAMRTVEEPTDSVSRLLNLVSKMDESQADSVLSILSGDQTKRVALGSRSEAVTENARRWLVIDYEIISDALNVEINPEMNPLVVRRILDAAISRMPSESKRDIPEVVWDFVRSLNEVFPGENSDSKMKVMEIKDSTIIVSVSTPSVVSSIKGSQRWMSWIDSNNVTFWQESNNIMFESPNFRGMNTTFAETVLESLME